MKISACIHTYSDKPLGVALDAMKKIGINTVDVCSGGYAGKYHCNPIQLLKDRVAFLDFKKEFELRDMQIGAFSCHGNGLHPQRDIAVQHDTDLKASIDLAAALGVKNVITFSGLPGDHEGAKYPNWCIYPFPAENSEILDYQWNEKLIPYWKEIGRYARERGVAVGIEPHGGFMVHSPATMIRLYKAVGEPSIGCNVDPSHFWWQGIDPVVAIRHLANAGCITYFHAKDTGIEPYNMNYYGLLDSQDMLRIKDRAWQFRSIGYGHDVKTWADILSTLRAVGYDGNVSIEHEDAMMSANEGFLRALNNLQSIMISEEACVPHILSIEA